MTDITGSLQVATECVHEQSSFLPTVERKPPRENKRAKLGAQERERGRGPAEEGSSGGRVQGREGSPLSKPSLRN